MFLSIKQRISIRQNQKNVNKANILKEIMLGYFLKKCVIWVLRVLFFSGIHFSKEISLLCYFFAEITLDSLVPIWKEMWNEWLTWVGELQVYWHYFVYTCAYREIEKPEVSIEPKVWKSLWEYFILVHIYS